MRRLWLLSVIAAVALLTVAHPAGAETVRIPFTGTSVLLEEFPPDRAWFSDGVYHVRGATSISRGTTTMGANEVTGITTTVVNFNVNLSTGDGSAWGTLETTQDDGGCGGTFTATLTGSAVSGKTVEKCFGELAGWQARTEFESTGSGRNAYTGFLFNPGG
jgi:hypothetical protein